LAGEFFGFTCPLECVLYLAVLALSRPASRRTSSLEPAPQSITPLSGVHEDPVVTLAALEGTLLLLRMLRPVALTPGATQRKYFQNNFAHKQANSIFPGTVQSTRSKCCTSSLTNHREEFAVTLRR
jgi:hypothetical protein